MDVSLDWEAANNGVYELDPMQTGDKLQHVKRLKINLQWHPAFGQQQVAQAKLLLDHLRMPSLEALEIGLMVSDDGFADSDISAWGCLERYRVA